MGLIMERDGAADGYETVAVPPALQEAAVTGGVLLRRRSVLASRRAVLYVHCGQDSLVAEDLVTWYTERGFHFYVADLRPQAAPDRAGARRRSARRAELAALDSACRHLRNADGIETIIVGGHSAGALTAALWCDARSGTDLADALILSGPQFGRRRWLDIGCPVLVMTGARDPCGGRARRGRWPAPRLGPHVTWLRLEDGADVQPSGADGARRRFYDEMGRWLGAYMYGQFRDQLL